ncbi:Rieske (2Fe-2S) protein [Aetokthonos hydrillicola Thurmond2011]|jgi:nitrite reductase/ring-hydroxylating ferredoxin subunit/flagellin-specific chaperone FliS|uniref:Rieske (2Fe-2S) protein n=1 Tax=Aetokthonos hydrillicola Thurmond2011 TaxID=2712845 RepID=A0AAP5I740_9CYAN|nr:Rieske (2Fe-2S) protein [Aetokthonos hydrillicola]MBO3458968.1 Rieske (2Fe-2S) protein [Aetokthonos hydrillicola CCALA 1050]MBW4589075.1 Rieske (2Fe-2S) protein [Aetokthonos hydrillicola CCALA 1050]MDR9894969.1 Rieske (2Fe-2S) protein [Aetokthonos hydrillicola Thurmond2011]
MTQALESTTGTQHYVSVAQVAEVKASGYVVVYAEGQAIALFYQGDKIYAIDNRCPHMGFPLHRGTVKDCILTCHWHHARFDLASGGTFDAWADDVRAFPVKIQDGQVWVDLAPHTDPLTYQRQRLQDGLEQGISLVIAKSVIALLDVGVPPSEPFRIGLDFGVRYRKAGWGSGLTIHTCMMNLLPYLDPEDRPRALYHGLSSVARDCAGAPPRFGVHPLPNAAQDIDILQRWFCQFVEVRDGEGAERCLVSAVHGGADQQQIAEMLFTAATDHRYIDVGHVIDFTNKALEALDATNWQDADSVLSSLVAEYASAERMEESNSWRYPVDLVAILNDAFAELPAALEVGRDHRLTWVGRDELVTVLLGDDARAIANSLLEALRTGCTEEQLAGTVAYAAALRIARFHTNNDFNDWDTAHHTFTFANAVHQGLRRVGSQALLRGVFDAAMSVYLNRFLNIPSAPLPEPNEIVDNPENLLNELKELLDRQQQVNQAGTLVALYLYSGGNPDQLLAVLGKMLLREDRSFHVIQEIEAAFRQYSLLRGTQAGVHVLIAAARYLAAHAPTMRSQEQTYQMANRLHRGDRLFD